MSEGGRAGEREEGKGREGERAGRRRGGDRERDNGRGTVEGREKR